MFDSIVGFLSNHLKFSRKRSLNDSDDPIPSKQLKYSTSTINMMDSEEREKENKADIEIVEEVQNSGWIAPRSSIRRKHLLGTASSTPIASTSTCSSPPTGVSNRTRRIVDSALRVGSHSQDDVQVLRSFRSPQSLSKYQKRSSISERLFGPFRPNRPRFGVQMKKKTLEFNNMRKFLEEKMTYKRLLDMQAVTRTVFSFPEIKAIAPQRKPLEVIDLEMELRPIRVARDRENEPKASSSKEFDKISEEVAIIDEKKVGSALTFKANSLEEYLNLHPIYKDGSELKTILNDHVTNVAEKRRMASLEEAKLTALTEQNEKNSRNALEERMRLYMKITEIPVVEIEEEEEEEIEYVLPELTDEDDLKVQNALKPGSPNEVLADKFDIKITRKDMNVFKGLKWLNDEVINFYMNLLMDRGKNDKMPKVYAFNTFFYQNMVNGRYSSLRRWTKKVDLFTFDMVFVPVHLGMHWCMSVIDFPKKEVRYYDSMGSENNDCLNGLLAYLQAESMDKKKVPFSTDGWSKINVGNIPQQMNGSDCGVFSCVFAEHIARNAPFNFSQEDMPYFRNKMVLEILNGNLIT